MAASGWLGIGGVVHLGRQRRSNPRPRPDGVLVKHGVYAHLRHPLYGSLVLGSIGWSLLWQSGVALGVSVVLAVFLDAKARHEERWLTLKFPEYASYARRVKRFVPGVY
jgi:protein-S-isoprenylcysteine O-methyltransferase Ste14